MYLRRWSKACLLRPAARQASRSFELQIGGWSGEGTPFFSTQAIDGLRGRTGHRGQHVESDPGEPFPLLEEPEEFRAQRYTVEPEFSLFGERPDGLGPAQGFFHGLDVADDREALDGAVGAFPPDPGFTKVEQEVEDLAAVAAAPALRVTAAKFVHGETDLPAVLHPVAEGQQSEAGPAMAHVERGRRGPSGRVCVADHPFDVVDDRDTGFGLPGGGEERGGDEIAGNNRDEMVFLATVTDLALRW